MSSPTTNNDRYQWRPATPADIDLMFDLSEIVHPDFPEDKEVFLNRMALYPDGTYILVDTEHTPGADPSSPWDHPSVGYSVSHPWPARSAPPLDTLFDTIPTLPQQQEQQEEPQNVDGLSLETTTTTHHTAESLWYYLHDCAISPTTRNTGGGKMLIEELKQAARARGFKKLSLTSVNNSQGYWEARGFVAIPRAELGAEMNEKLLSYGEDAVFMTLTL